MQIRSFLPLTFLLLIISHTGQAQTWTVSALRCEYLREPLGLDEPHPRLTWQFSSTDPATRPDQWRVQVALDPVDLARGRQLQWDTTFPGSSFPLLVYSGRPLQPFQKYYWRLEGAGRNSTKKVQASSFFEMGMMTTAAWRGFWISDGRSRDVKEAPLFRKTFTIRKKIKAARVYVAAAGLYELSINGKKTGDRMLDPAYTRFDRRVLYSSFNITDDLQTGENVIGMLLGNGWYNHQSTAVWNFHQAPWRNRPAFCLDLRLEYADGTVEYVFSDRDWKTTTGDIVFNSIYTGEHIDHRRAIESWNMPGFIDSSWKNAGYRAAPAPLLVAQAMPPVRATEIIQPAEVRRFSDTLLVVKFPINLAGVVRLKVEGRKGAIIRVKHGERVYPNGRVDQSNLDVHYRPTDDLDPFQTDIFILSGKGMEVFQPRFNYKGFQYVEISCSEPVKFSEPVAEALRMHSDVAANGSIRTSHSLLQRLWEATNNSYLSNLFGYPTDCPQREKNGWTGDAHIAQETGLYNFDGITVYEKWMADHRDEQQPNGVLPSIIPTGGWGYDWGNGPDWTSTIAIIPWNLYLFYGDNRALRLCYEPLKRYVNHIDQLYPSGITSWGLGDWIPVKSRTAVPFTSTAYYYRDVTILARAAALFGCREDLERYNQLAKKIRDAFNQQYFDSVHHTYGKGLQTELSVALHFELVPEQYRSAVATQLANRVQADSVRLDVGLLGTKAILNALSENGYAALAYQLVTNDDFPSWGWWIRNGATSLYENWPIDAASDISMNHIMFGEVGAWMYKGIAGIRPDPMKPGFRHFFVRPYFAPDLPDFAAAYNSPFGEIRSQWVKNVSVLNYTITVPDNTTATLELPVVSGRHWYLNGTRVPLEGTLLQKQLRAGTYLFEWH